MSLSIQLMTTFKPSSGIQSNLVVGIYFTLNCKHCQCMRSAAPCTSSVSINAWSISIGLTRASSKWILVCISILSSCVLNQWRSISIELTRTSSKWICFGYVWNRDVTILQFGYAAFMVEIFYVRWSILDQSLHWDLFMRDIMAVILYGVYTLQLRGLRGALVSTYTPYNNHVRPVIGT